MNNWKERLKTAYFEHMSAEANSRKKLKLFTILDCLNQDAIAEAHKFEFSELQEWAKYIIPDHLQKFFSALKLKASNDYEKLLYLFMSSDDDKTLRQEIKCANISLLPTLLEYLISVAPSFPKRKEKIVIILSERPDVLLEMHQFLLIDMNKVIDGACYIHFNNIQLLLKKIKNVDDFQKFGEKISHRVGLRKGFESNKTVIEAWNSLSDYEFAKAKNFKEMIDVYFMASPDWQTDLNNFKIILNALNSEDLIYFFDQLEKNHHVDDFTYGAAVIAARRIIKKEIKSGISFITIYSKAIKIDCEISKLQKRIIEEYLDS